jgi:hypothetical protein
VAKKGQNKDKGASRENRSRLSFVVNTVTLDDIGPAIDRES